MSKENDKIFRTLEHIAITFDKLGYSPTIPIFKGHQDFEWLFKLELDTIKALCNQQDRQIAELEAKLAESEEKYTKMWKWEVQQINRLQEENNQLKQQLTEKDKEILDVKNWWSYQYNGEIERHNQDKISFAVEQLEIVKDLAECVLDNALKNSSLNQSYYDRLLDEIDNQIKQLTHQHEDKGE